MLKNLPGQRQGAQAWFNHLVEFLESIGFEFCKENACLWRKADQVFVLIHVDGILYYGQEEAVQHFIEQLREKFEISVSQMKLPGDELDPIPKANLQAWDLGMTAFTSYQDDMPVT